MDESKQGIYGDSVRSGNETLAVEVVDEKDEFEELASVDDDNVGPTKILSGREVEEETGEISSDD